MRKHILPRMLSTALAASLCLCGMPPVSAAVPSTFKVLAIGNSFSEDATRYLYQIAEGCGATEIVIGNLYIGGCTLNTHWNNAKDNRAAYTYFKNTDGQWRSSANQTMLTGLEDEEWDMVTLQQASGVSGAADTYNSDLDNLIAYVKGHMKAGAKLYWHMTWAYQGDSNHGDFGRYDRNQMTMYRAILDAVQTKIVTNNAFDGVIPAGTAIQNARTSFLGDTLTRDGYHLSEGIGRYVAGLTWAKALGLALDGLEYLPDGIPASYLPMLKEAAEKAVASPYAVTASTHTEAPTYDLSAYTLFDWEPVGCAYWNSTASTTLNSRENSTASNLINYVASGRRFTREELPVGSLIVVDKGYQYRPEGWGHGLSSASARPDNVTTAYMEVDEAWWKDYQYRAFNISKTNLADISQEVEETASHFRIYIPKKGTPAPQTTMAGTSAPATGGEKSSLPLFAGIGAGLAVLTGTVLLLLRRRKLQA